MILEDLAKGYDKESEYFYKLNKELIERRRRELDQQRAAQAAQQEKAAHWMRCPKCGHQLKQANLLGIVVDECSGCGGLFLDRGEVRTLLEVKEPQGAFVEYLRRILGLESPAAKAP